MFHWYKEISKKASDIYEIFPHSFINYPSSGNNISHLVFISVFESIVHFLYFNIMINKGIFFLIFFYFLNNNLILLWPNIYWKHSTCNGVGDTPVRGRNALTKTLIYIYTNFPKRYQKNLALFPPNFTARLLNPHSLLFLFNRTVGWNFCNMQINGTWSLVC